MRYCSTSYFQSAETPIKHFHPMTTTYNKNKGVTHCNGRYMSLDPNKKQLASKGKFKSCYVCDDCMRKEKARKEKNTFSNASQEREK